MCGCSAVIIPLVDLLAVCFGPVVVLVAGTVTVRRYKAMDRRRRKRTAATGEEEEEEERGRDLASSNDGPNNTYTKSPRPMPLTALLVVVAAVWWCLGCINEPQPWRQRARDWLGPDRLAPDRTLVAYVYSGTDEEYANNFRYFLREGIRPNDRLVDYVLVIQQVQSPAAELPTEDLARVKGYDNVRIVEHDNSCYDLGTLGWLYTELEGQGGFVSFPSSYAYFVWVNSSVRGPFLPPYIDPQTTTWTRALTDKLNDRVKLVGATVSCGASGPHPPTVHVQSYVVATDAVGLDLIRKNATVLACYDTMQDVVFYGERGITETILNAGYGIDSLMARYQGMDWSKGSSSMETIEALGCNADMNPIQPGFYDGTDVDPMEVMFVKVKSAFLEADPPWPSAMRAHRLSIWKGERGDATAASDNDVLPRLDAMALRLVEEKEKETPSRAECFDWKFYLRANRQDPLVGDEVVGDEQRAAAAFEQFATMGIYEGRPHRWLC